MKTPAVIARHGVLLCAKKWKHKITLTNLVDGILTNTESIKRIYDGYGWFDNGFVKVVYNGIEDKSQVRAYDFSHDFPGKKVIFSAGRLTEQKGFADLIHAAAALARQRQDLVFVIAGKGRLEHDLKNLAQRLHVNEMVRFWGFHENIDPYLKGCYLFVLTSHFEGMPNVVMEAMAVGKAVIATDVNGVRELMEPEKTGRIVAPRDPEALARAIGDLIDQQPLLEQFGREGLKRVQACFTIPRMIKNLEDYFSSLLHAK
jgi:glycosyltransferase involved in cell wall biosynthesis